MDVNDGCVLAPESMAGAVQEYCRRTGQPVPFGLGEICRVIYQSRAECYGRTIKELEQNTGKFFDRIQIIGGGANAGYLNQLTADITGKDVYAGPVEATAVGNLMAQMIGAGELKDLSEARQCVFDSFGIEVYRPRCCGK